MEVLLRPAAGLNAKNAVMLVANGLAGVPPGLSSHVLIGASVVVLRHEGSAHAAKEVEVSALVGLKHMVNVEFPVAAL